MRTLKAKVDKIVGDLKGRELRSYEHDRLSNYANYLKVMKPGSKEQLNKNKAYEVNSGKTEAYYIENDEGNTLYIDEVGAAEKDSKSGYNYRLLAILKQYEDKVNEIVVHLKDGDDGLFILEQIGHLQGIGGLKSDFLSKFHTVDNNTIAKGAEFKPMSSAELKERMGKDSGSRLKGSKEYRNMVGALDTYHQTMDRLNQKLAVNADTPGDLKEAMNARGNLLQATQAYIDKHDKARDGKGKLAKELKEQINNADPLSKFNATDVTNTKEGEILGYGSKGPIYSRILPDGFEAAVKFDSTEATKPAEAVKIDPNNPQEARRGVTTYVVDEFLGLDAIPETRMVTQTDADGTVRMGQAMEVVHGFDGQKFVVNGNQLSPDEINLEFNGIEIKTDDQFKVEFDDNIPPKVIGVWRHSPKVVDINYRNPKIQKGWSKLQWEDNIAGAADRHPGNVRYESSGPDPNDITDVKGLDNDDAHGRGWESKAKSNSLERISPLTKTPGYPPLVDVETAIGILEKKDSELGERLKLLPPEDANQEIVRFIATKAAVIERIKDRKLASDNGKITREQIKKLQAAGVPNDVNIKVDFTWGTEKAENVHTRQNSYLGEILARKEMEGVTDPIYK